MMNVDVTKGIKVGGYNFEVQIDSKLDKELEADGKLGDCSLVAQRIRIHSTSNALDASNTFIHEAIHSVDKVYLGSTLTENQVTVLANGIHQVMESLGVRFGKPE